VLVYPDGMLAPDRALAFALVAFGIIVVPGPSVLFVISRGVVLGRRAALATAVGNNAGLWLQVVAVAVGLGTILSRSLAVFTIIKLGGAGYLIFLGIQAVRHRRTLAAALGAPAPHRRTRRILREGFVVGLTNPKAALLFTAILPQFVDRTQGHVPVQLLGFGLIAVAIALVSDSAWAMLAGTARAWLCRTPRRLELLGGTGGVIMIGLGVRLALSGRKD